MGRQRRPAEGPAEPDPRQDRRFVTALARGLDLLRCFQPKDRWLPHQELARRSGLPAATVSRLSFTLTALGYLRHRPATGEYALAPAALTLGFRVLTNFELGRIARPHMEALAEQTQAAVSLGVRHGTEMVYVAHCRSTARLILGLDVGTRIPLAPTAMGRAMWSAADAGLRALVLRALQAEQPRDWPRLLEGLQRAEREVAQRGYACSASEWESEIAAVGVGVDPGDGREPLALTVGGPAARLQGALLHEQFAPALVRTGQAIVDAIQSGGWQD
ncbi:IclR family transcriptional regulator [Piscinibacter sakaiensis]|uniref:Transcriptional regulator, IclR family n=1 Tax=Piscinibacter sakaiensis TaxID=1547922 RepID=A0A0K8NVT1_PISS1|nr:IclR family transcriptional regulator [Piscinibacter sakaiensis]GAP34502.1 transcriptional regulator, IclR family [Piscinibacter sakaiensis]